MKLVVLSNIHHWKEKFDKGAIFDQNGPQVLFFQSFSLLTDFYIKSVAAGLSILLNI